jgi:hypothetical protein
MNRLSLFGLPLAVALASCGGGGDEDQCASVSAFSITTTWTVTGGAYNPPPVRDQMVEGHVGVPLNATPVHVGVPAGCAGKGTYTLGSAAYPLPAGLSLNSSTGQISGTPTVAGSTTGGGTDTGAVRLSFPGYSSTQVLTRVDVSN